MSELSARPVVLESTSAELALTARETISTTTTTSISADTAAQGAPRLRRGAVVSRALLAADVAAASCAYVVAAAVGQATGAPDASLAALLVAVPAILVGARLRGLHARDEQRPNHSTLDELGDLAGIATGAVWLALLVMWVASGEISFAPAVALWAGSAALLVAARSSARAVARRHPAYRQNALILGAGEVGQLLARKLLQHPEFGLRVVGFVDGDPKELRPGVDGVPVLAATGDLAHVVETYDVDRVMVAFSQDSHDVLVPLVRSLRNSDVQIDFVPRLFDAVDPVSTVNVIEGLPLVSSSPTRCSPLARATKRTVDVVVAATLLALTLPLFAWCAWRIKRDSPGPVFFRQTRLGEGRRSFTMLKFRTMGVDTDAAPHREYLRGIMDVGASPAANNLYKLDRRADVTRVGAWLRRTSLDELPQLINVLRGDMSLVGPRPCIPYETELFEPHHFDRFLVPAGMTGLWQVTARARATFKEALDLDVSYARTWSLRLDAGLLVRTPLALLRDKATA